MPAPAAVLRAARLRTATLLRAEQALARLRRRRLLQVVLAAWREPVWRGRRQLQRQLNVLRYRVATRRAAAGRLAAAFAAWLAARVPPPPGLAPPWPRQAFQ